MPVRESAQFRDRGAPVDGAPDFHCAIAELDLEEPAISEPPMEAPVAQESVIEKPAIEEPVIEERAPDPIDDETAPLQWDDSMSVGVEALDEDHKFLIGLLNQVSGAVVSGDPDFMVTRSVLLSLVDYLDFHFKREENVMEAVGYPDLEAHKDQNRIDNNLVVAEGDEEVGFVNAPELDFRLREDARVWRQVKGFEPIPLERVGLYVDEYRKAIPQK